MMIAAAGGSSTRSSEDSAVIAAVNRMTGAGLAITGRAELGKLGGAILAEWPDGRPGVVTEFIGTLAEAERVADVLNDARMRGLPLARHELVVDLDGRVVFVQERLRKAPPQKLTRARVEAIVAINDRFADALVHRPDMPPVLRWFDLPGAELSRLSELIFSYDTKARDVLDAITRLTTDFEDEIATGVDLVHVDLSPANVLFDENNSATAVVDWNLGAFRGDRLFALVQTRFDREWFVQNPDADPIETDAAAYLDKLITDRIHPETLRIYWAYWLRHHLHNALRAGPPAVVNWQLQMARSRLL